ncbi:MAG TPA: polysaccharide deacetylase family protein [Gemmatimonadaceae bacterium]|nr:polysaccharide deacetylase family protein [Gemmatimonadaceae bacterium]
MIRTFVIVVALLTAAAACRGNSAVHSTAVITDTSTAQLAAAPVAPTPAAASHDTLPRVPILEYHIVGTRDSRWSVQYDHFRAQLEMLYAHGYRPITVAQLVDRTWDIPRGTRPIVFTFDDASPSQFSYVEHNGTLEIDSTSAIGIWLDFHRKHPDWGNRATFCLLPAAAAGHAFFGDKGIDGQQTAWRFRKVQYLAQQGFELCDHTLWHANLSLYSDEVVQEQIARSSIAIDSAVPGYRVRTFALPLGIWPKNRALATAGSWRDPKTGRVTTYRFDAVLMVSGGSAPNPLDPRFDALKLPRIEVFGDAIERMLGETKVASRR